MKTYKILFAVLVVMLLVADANAFYDPNKGRWLSRDPIAERGGLNLYAFVKNNPLARIDLYGLKCCGQFAVMEVKGLEVPESQQASADGKSRVNGFKVLYWPCDDCTCPADKIKLVQARTTPGYSASFDVDKNDEPYIGLDNVVVTPEYSGWKGPETYSYLDGPYNRLSPNGTFTAEVCAVCRNGQKVLGCVTFSFNMGTRRLSVPDGAKMAKKDLAQFGNPGQQGEGIGEAGYIKGCNDPAAMWGKAMKAWEAKLQP